MLTGNLEVANPRRLEGWAQDDLRPNTPVTLVIINNGVKVGRVVANRYRPDLEQASIGDGRHAFDFEFPATAISTELHVVRIISASDGAELPGSPVTLRASQCFDSVVHALAGSVDGVGPDGIAGWARDELHPDTRVPLLVVDNDKVVGHVLADKYRQDLNEAGIGDGRHAFELMVLFDPSESHVVHVRRESDGVDIPGSPVSFGASQANASSAAPLMGSVDAANRFKISGWTQDRLQPNVPVSLLITNNDEFLGRVLSNGYREDLKQAGIGNGRFAFEFEFPVPLAPYETQLIRVIREIDGVEIPGSPVTLSASRSFDSEIEESLKQALDQCGSSGDVPRKIDFLVDQIERLLQQNADAESLRAERDRYRRLLQRWNRQLPQVETTAAITVTAASFLRALVIDDRLPRADRDAGSNAVLSHVRSLQRLGYQVTFVPAGDLNPIASDRAAIEKIGVSCCCLPYYGSVEEVLRRQAGEFDVVYLHRVTSASKYGELVATHFPKARRIYSVADLHHVRLLRQAAVEDRPELVALGKRLRLAELTAAAFSSAVVTHSESETKLLRSLVPGASVFTVPWSVKPLPTKVPFSQRKGFAFIGGFGHAPNQDAVRWLIKDIMPLVRSRDPSIRCYLVGSDMPEQFREIATDGIEPVGHVENLSEIFDRVRLTVAPLAYGAGLKGKVIESMSAGIPCVCTNVAAEGFDLPVPLRACIADDADAIAASVVRLHNKKTENERCRRAGLEFVKTEFSENRLDELMSDVVGLTRSKPGSETPSVRHSTAQSKV
jgi:glycosyltransferase involved in cell wall biosynthesis